MIDEGPVSVAIYTYYFLLTRGRPFVLPLLLRAHSSARLPDSHRGRILRIFVCIHIKSDNTLRASPVLAATTLPGRRQAGLFSKPPSETVRKVLRARSRREFGQDREGEMG